ncbi:hypothetical protein F4808DRAFT_462251 [Astrocystis sublimbata]|nr:hypothetical protein F4808DRAFT_462251 [Astrocystis sublimbata]
MPDDDVPRTFKKHKLRSSCDRCGTAKLKCDRGHPECDRCVYGVSRKNGKPRRDRLCTSLASPGSDQISATGDDEIGSSNASCDGFTVDTGLMSGMADTPADIPITAGSAPITLDPVAANSNGLMLDLEVDSVYNNFPMPPISDFTSLDLDGWTLPGYASDRLSTVNSQPTSAHTPNSPYPGNFSWTGVHSEQLVTLECNGNINLQTGSALQAHDCSQQAYEIMRSLSIADLSSSDPTSASGMTPSIHTEGSVNRVPLDHILRANHESTERLSHLLACSCSVAPALALLHASIISRMLMLYQEATSSVDGITQYPEASNMDVDILGPLLTASSSSSGSRPWPSTWPSTPGNTRANDGSGGSPPPAMTSPSWITVAPPTMAIGTFDVDDMRIMAAVKMQLLLGEVRKLGQLIDYFTSQTSSKQSSSSQHTFGSVASLYHSLGAWLKTEHSRIASMISSKLREFNN